MLLAVPKYGRVKVNKMLLTCRISPSKTIGGLSERQRSRAGLAAAPLAGPSTCPSTIPAGFARKVAGVARQGHVFVITGPSGVGKGTLIRGLMERMPELELSVSATTRSPRAGRAPGRRLPLPQPRRVRRASRAGEFVEDVDYAGSSYGTLRSELEGRAAVGGARGARDRGPGRAAGAASAALATQIFIAPPSLEELRRRLLERGTDDPEKVERRLLVAREELEARAEFAYVVLNDQLERALEELEGVVRRELEG